MQIKLLKYREHQISTIEDDNSFLTTGKNYYTLPSSHLLNIIFEKNDVIVSLTCGFILNFQQIINRHLAAII